jgi:hypothetical protein
VLKKIILTLLLTAVLGAPSAQAFRLEGYNWGDSRNSVIEKLAQKKWTVRPSRVEQMVETDAFLAGEPCLVQFMFNRSLRLNRIRVTWDTTRVGDELVKALTQRHKNPSEASPGGKHYAWKGSFKGEEITLDYSDLSGLPNNRATLVLDGGDAYR